jgi:hypothetical protein
MDPVSTNDESRTREHRPSPLNKAHLGKASLGRVTAQSGAGTGRRAQVAIAVFVAIGIGVAYGYGVAPAANAPAAAASLASTAVRTATIVCPEVTGPTDATVNAITPTTGGKPATGDTATVTALGGKTPIATLKQTGTLSVNGGLSGDPVNLNQSSIPVIGQATGAYAPGFTATETLSSGTTTLHGLASTACAAPDTDFWYLGADPSSDAKTAAELNLYNGDQISAQLNLTGYTANGLVDTSLVQQKDQGVLVLPGTQASHPIELSDFSTDGSPVAVHVTTTAGRISAALLDSDGPAGRDFIQAQRPAPRVVIPGVPSSKSNLQLILFSPSADTDVSLHWIGGSKITPTVTAPHLTAGKVQHLDITGVPAAGEAGALEIDSTGNTPILAEIKVTGQGGSDTAYLSPVQALTGESLVADDNSGSVVELTNNGGQDAQVKVTTEGTGAPAAQTVAVPAYSTKAVTVQAPKGTSTFAVSVTPLGGANSIYAARVMTGGGGMITIQPMTTALETVQIPVVRDDLSGTVPQ